jgi:nucleoside-diphosphate-sugar epimerase
MLSKKKNILIIGGNSYIIQHFLNKAKNIYKIYITTNKNNNFIKYKKIKNFKLNLLKPNFKILPKKIDFIIICAASTNMHNKKIKEINYLSIKKITNYAKNAGVKKVVFMSSILVNDYLKNINDITKKYYNYAKYKYFAENFLLNSEFLTSYIIRLPGVISGESSKPFLSTVANKLLKNATIKIYNQNFRFNNLIHPSDLTKLIFRIFKSNEHKNITMQLASRWPMKLINIINFLRKNLNSTSKIINFRTIKKSETINFKFAKKKFNYKPLSVKQVLKLYLYEIKKDH